MSSHSDLARPAGRSRTLLVLRVSVLSACAWIAVPTLASVYAGSPPSWDTRAAALTVTAASLALFAGAAWRNLAGAAAPRLQRGAIVLLALQTLIASTISTDLFILLSLMLPLVLPPRAALPWFCAQSLLLVIIGLSFAGTSAFGVDPMLHPLPRTWQVALSFGQVLAWNLLAYAGGLLAATELRARRQVSRLVTELELTNDLLAQTSRLAEREHIARELHDTIGHRLAALGVHLQLAERRTDGEAAAALREARAATRELLAEVREVVEPLRHERPLELKRSLAHLLARTAGLEVEFTLSPELDVRDPERAHALYRCAQEALTNALRHSGATRMWLDVRQNANGVTLRAWDDGRGLGDAGPGHGLSGMRERLESLGGTLALSSSREGGLELTAWLPATGDPA